LKEALDKMQGAKMTVSQQKAFAELGDDSKEHAEHIGANSGNIKHQREHFKMLSENMYDLLKAFGSSETIYQDYCPMAKATWLSESTTIKNPYYGNKMLSCGEVQDTIR
jgi:hypothetical protein